MRNGFSQTTDPDLIRRIAGNDTFPTLPELFGRWQQLQDNEQRIVLGETLLAREASLDPWPLAAARELVRAELLFGTASAYVARPTGSRADNIEAAINRFEAALPAWTFERDPQNWATLRNNLGIAYWARIRGERADNQERAIAHFEQSGLRDIVAGALQAAAVRSQELSDQLG